MLYSKSITIRFDNAGIMLSGNHYQRKNKTKFWIDRDGIMTTASKDDRILSGKSRELRTKDQWIEQRIGTFHYSFIENVIRVLCGERPICKYRNTCVNRSDNYHDIAKRAYIKIDSLIYENNDGELEYASEKMTSRKCLDNSWAMATPSWIRFKYLLPESLYNDLVIVANDICKCNAENLLFNDVADILFASKDERVTKLVDDARTNQCGPLAQLLTGSKIHSLQQAGYRGLAPYLRTLVVKGVCDVIRLDGMIHVPVTDSELELFRNGNGIASLFDGGFVRIDHVCDLEYTSFEFIASGSEAVQL